MYAFRARDRRLMEQTARDLSLCLQRDYRSFNPKRTTSLSTRQTFFTGYLNSPPYAYPNIFWTAGSQVDMAFNALEQLINDLNQGQYQTGVVPGPNNPGAWPVATVNWKWIMSLYAYLTPSYATWLTNNGIVVPNWLTGPG